MSETGRCLGTFQDAVFDYFLSVQVDNYLLLLRLRWHRYLLISVDQGSHVQSNVV